MLLTKTIAKELIEQLAINGRTIVGDDHSFEKTIRIVEYGRWTLIVTTSNTLSLFEDKKAVFSILVKDTAHDVADLLIRAYDKEDELDYFEYL
jgi:hypothetical protein